MTFDDARGIQADISELRLCRWSQARPVDDHHRGKRSHALRLMPGAKQARRVPTEDEKQLIVRMRAMERAQRVRRVGAATALDLDVRHLEARLALDRQFG